MKDSEYFSTLYEIASDLNKEFSLQAALRKALEKTVDLLGLETGWIWLVQGDTKSVYLAASYNLPPALGNYPERLSGWCYCIQKYFSDSISGAKNISEITCTRLKEVKKDTRDLKFHATVPIFVQGEKAGLLNLLHKESQQLDDTQLSILNTISELLGIAIQRTRFQSSFSERPENSSLQDVLDRVLSPRLESLLNQLQTHPQSEELQKSIALAQEMQEQLGLILGEVAHKPAKTPEGEPFHYPTSPLTKRELEVLRLVKKGDTNKQIAEQLFISERTVKFHISSILGKLYAETRTEAVDIALRRGVLEI